MKANYGVECLVNTQLTHVVVKEIQDSNNGDMKYVYIDYNTCEQGDTISINGLTWMLVQQDESMYQIYDKLMMKRVKHTINFIVDEELKTYPLLFDVGTQFVDESKYMNVVDGKLKLIVPENETTNKIKLNDRCIKFQSAWKVIAVTDENKGLLNVYCEKDIFTDGDDKVN